MIVTLLACTQLHAKDVKNSAYPTIKNDIIQMYKSMEKGDATIFLEKTYEGIYKLMGVDKTKGEAVLKNAISQMAKQKMQYLEVDVKKPLKTYHSKNEEACFVPINTVMKLQGKKIKSVGFMIAVKKKGSKLWKYIDGAGVSKHKEALWVLLPWLKDQDIKLPSTSMEML
jgi:hypothetical protein